MPSKYKNLIQYTILAILVFGLIRGCDYIIKKPDPISREVDPRILQIDSEIAAIKSTINHEAFRRDSVDRTFSARMDSMRIDHQKAKNEKKKLKYTPDSYLSAYNDSLLRANGLK